MTASTVKSTIISNAESVPVSLAYNNIGGRKKAYMATIEAATTSLDETGDIMLMLPIPSKLVPTSIKLFNDDLDSNGTPALTVHVGLYRSDTGAVLDADCFAAASTALQSAVTSGTELLFKTADIANIGKRAWEYAAGVTSDPGVKLYVGLTIGTAAATAAAGTISLLVEGTLPD